MSVYNFPTHGGIRFQHGPWTIVIYQQADFNGLGDMTVLGHETAGGIVVTAILDGPYPNFQQRIDQFGGMGNWTFALRPSINAALKKHYDLTPDIPPLSNATAYSVQDANYVFSQFWKAVIDTADQVPVFTPR